MVSTYTPNKNLEKPGNGDYVDTWNVPANGDFDIIDQAFGGVTSLNATAGDATLTDTEYQSLILSVSGAMSANTTYTIPSGVGGQWIVRNTTTDNIGGPWSVTFQSGGGGTTVAVARSANTIIWSDGTNIRSSGITSIDVSGGTTGLTTSGGPITNSGTITIAGTLGAGNGGTGRSTLTANNVVLGNGTSAVQLVAPGTSGNVLTSDGTTWSSQAVAGGFSNWQIFTSNGTFTVPAGVTKVKVTVVGGGGGGTASGGNSGAGGGGGAAIKIISGLTPGGTVAVTVGAGGAAGSDGGTSSFGAYCSATGGKCTGNQNGGPGGIGSGGDLNIAGQGGNGGALVGSRGYYGGGGSSILGGGGNGNVDGGGGAGGAYGGGGGSQQAGASGVVIVEY